ncbi:hypothetical protein F5Y15DRAFT_286538 [Xylariaceae sp. FL0016]|nr:hypothetical protein F5Y15DRAFT_286538 [Xylariaceae sp. FL0016]
MPWEAPSSEKPSQISGPTALGTQLLSPGSGPGSRFPPAFLATPEAVQRRPVPVARSVDEEVDSFPNPPAMINNNNTGSTIVVGRSLTESHAPSTAPQPALMPRMPFDSPSPTEAYVPIVHAQDHAQTHTQPRRSIVPIVMPPIPPTPSDDGFTPVTPVPSPRNKGFKLTRASQLPRDALGIAAGRFKSIRSPKATRFADEQDEYDDVTPLSPTGAKGLRATTEEKPEKKRKTLFGVLEGWWDLGLLERGLSLKRRG